MCMFIQFNERVSLFRLECFLFFFVLFFLQLMCGNSQKLNDEPSFVRLDICVKKIDLLFGEKEENGEDKFSCPVLTDLA